MKSAFIMWVMLALVSSCALAEETKNTEPIVYYGDLKVFSKPAAIEAGRVLESHPAYKKIQEKKLKSTEAEYWLLMNEFNSALRDILTEISGDKGYDLVMEKGSTLFLTEVSTSDSPPKIESRKYEGEVPDITGSVIEKLSAKK